MSDEYVPVEHTPAPEAPISTTEVPIAVEERQPKMQRTVSEATRKAFQAMVAKQAEAAKTGGDDLVPVDTTSAPAPVAAKPEAGAEDLVPVDIAASAAPVAPPPAVEAKASAADAAARAIAEQQRAALEAKEKEIAAAREALEVERKKLPGADAWVEKPTHTLKALVQSQLGLTDEEWKDFQADLISEATAESLGVPLDQNHRTGIDARRAKLAVRTYTSEQKRQAEALKAEQARFAEQQRKLTEEQAETQRAHAAKQAIGSMLTPLAAQHPFLFKNHDNADPSEVVYHVLKNQRDAFVKQYGENAQFQPDVAAAAKLANDYYRNHYESLKKQYDTLLAPTPAPTAPAAVKPSPQVSAQVPRSTTQPPPKAEPEQPAHDPVSDWRAERAANRRKRLEAMASRARPEE